MRLTHFGITTAVLILTVLHTALDSMYPAHQLPVSSYINLAIFILPAAALMLHTYLLVRASLTSNYKNSVAIQVEQAARIASVAELASRIDSASAVVDASQAATHDALNHGTGALKVNIGPGEVVAIENIPIKDIVKHAEPTPTADKALAALRARLWAELQSPELGCPAIPSKMVSLGEGQESPASARLLDTIAKQKGEKYLSVPFPVKRQGHGGARKRARERRAAGAV